MAESLGVMHTTRQNFISFRHSVVSFLVAVSAFLSLIICASGKDLVSSDLAGTWKLVYQESSGKKLPDEKAAEMFHGKMVFNGSEIRYTVELQGFDFTFSYLLRSDQQPTGIDLTLKETPEGKGAGKTFLGICRLEGDTLQICYNTDKRPAKFVAEEGSGSVLIVLKKAPMSK